MNIESEELTMANVLNIGVTIGDANQNDDVIASNIPGSAESYPGGAAIFNQTPPQKNIALIDSDGAIRMMQDGYKLRLKNEDSGNPYIFQIITENEEPIFDVYIHANFDNLVIKDEARELKLRVLIDDEGKIELLEDGEYSDADVTLIVPLRDALNIFNNAENINPLTLLGFAVNVKTIPAEIKNEVIQKVLRGEYN